ncbi:hypothetical protein AJ87_20975 [Rhizobium yanglingense]|nr:hypothetical protein AJ87_20975 [Rhizobium yanglingense]
MAEMPRLKNGKIDYPSLERRAAEIGVAETSVSSLDQESAPNDMKVASAIRRLVPDARFTPSSRFSDIGFDSLGLMSLELELSSIFPHLTVADFYRFPTVAALEAHLERTKSPVKLDVTHPVRLAGRTEYVSVVGMACRFPGALTTKALWDNLVGGQCLITKGDHEVAKEEAKEVPDFLFQALDALKTWIHLTTNSLASLRLKPTGWIRRYGFFLSYAGQRLKILVMPTTGRIPALAFSRGRGSVHIC